MAPLLVTGRADQPLIRMRTDNNGETGINRFGDIEIGLFSAGDVGIGELREVGFQNTIKYSIIGKGFEHVGRAVGRIPYAKIMLPTVALVALGALGACTSVKGEPTPTPPPDSAGAPVITTSPTILPSLQPTSDAILTIMPTPMPVVETVLAPETTPAPEPVLATPTANPTPLTEPTPAPDLEAYPLNMVRLVPHGYTDSPEGLMLQLYLELSGGSKDSVVTIYNNGNAYRIRVNGAEDNGVRTSEIVKIPVNSDNKLKIDLGGDGSIDHVEVVEFPVDTPAPTPEPTPVPESPKLRAGEHFYGYKLDSDGSTALDLFLELFNDGSDYNGGTISAFYKGRAYNVEVSSIKSGHSGISNKLIIDDIDTEDTKIGFDFNNDGGIDHSIGIKAPELEKVTPEPAVTPAPKLKLPTLSSEREPDANTVVRQGNMILGSDSYSKEFLESALPIFTDLYEFFANEYGVRPEFYVEIEPKEALTGVKPFIFFGGRTKNGSTKAFVPRDLLSTDAPNRLHEGAVHEATHYMNIILHPPIDNIEDLKFDTEEHLDTGHLQYGNLLFTNQGWYNEGWAEYLRGLYYHTRVKNLDESAYKFKDFLTRHRNSANPVFRKSVFLYEHLKENNTFPDDSYLDAHIIGEALIVILQEEYGFTPSMLREVNRTLALQHINSWDNGIIDIIDLRDIRSGFEQVYGKPLDGAFQKLRPGIEYNGLT